MSSASTTLETPLGALTVTADETAIVRVSWGGASPLFRTPLLRDAVDQLRAYFDRRLKTFDLPFRFASTPFDTSVWRRLLEIPYGQTETYGAVATAIGASPRAVGGACGRNPIAVIVPCHRVVGAGGRLVGYSGGNGVTTKASLLEIEDGAVNDQFELFHVKRKEFS